MEIKNLKYSRTFFSKDGYIIALFTSKELLDIPGEAPSHNIVCKGVNLPADKNREFIFKGEFKTDSTKGSRISFAVESFEEVMPVDEEGVIRYLKTLKGVGNVTAPRIYMFIMSKAAGTDKQFFDILDDIIENNADELLKVKGVKPKAISKIKESYIERTEGRELFAYLSRPPFSVAPSVIYKIYEKYKNEAMDIVLNEPYQLTKIKGIGFNTADKIARMNHLPLDSIERIKAGIFELLLENENGGQLLSSLNRTQKDKYISGNTCIEWESLYYLVNKALGINLSPSKLAKILKEMEFDKVISIEKNNYFSLYSTALHEKGIAKHIIRLLKEQPSVEVLRSDVNGYVESEASMGRLNSKLSSEQMDAVVNSLNSSVSVITGGPGTGKTMIQKIIIGMYEILHPDKNILLVAPTGRAARRMSESTGRKASTMHQALGLIAGETEMSGAVTNELDYGLIIVDEFSMVDTSLAYFFFSSVVSKAQVVIIGDVKQLPSVGPGCVLKELINSKTVAVSTLNQVFRQAGNSSIAYNAKRIDLGKTQMEIDDSFQFVEVDSSEKIVEKIKTIYPQLVEEYGLNEVCVLSPFKKSTITGTNSLNNILRTIVHRDYMEEMNIELLPNNFMIGDKVMYTKNNNGLSNGDIGIVTSVSNSDGISEVSIDFQDGRVVSLSDEDLNELEFAYATTVHKCQGSESKAVIFIVDKPHSILLKRNLTYTALTRARSKILCVGQQKMFDLSISREDTTKRMSRLGEHLESQYIRFKEDIETQMTIKCR